MESIKQIIADPTPYTGSELTRDMVREQIEERWGPEEAKRYDPTQNARTFTQWLKLGYVPCKGEKALRSITFVEIKDPTTGKVTKRIKRTVCLFFDRQVITRGGGL